MLYTKLFKNLKKFFIERVIKTSIYNNVFKISLLQHLLYYSLPKNIKAYSNQYFKKACCKNSIHKHHNDVFEISQHRHNIFVTRYIDVAKML